jgi:hypothetical protein
MRPFERETVDSSNQPSFGHDLIVIGGNDWNAPHDPAKEPGRDIGPEQERLNDIRSFLSQVSPQAKQHARIEFPGSS